MGIKDELREILFLQKPTIIIAEWLPSGNNQIAALNYKLGSMERLKSTLLTTLVDEFPEQSIFESDPVHSQVVVNEFSLTKFVEFTAKVDIPEEEGIVQEEEFGVHMCEQGLTVFACDLAEVDGKQEQVSLDKLTRVNADLFMDSSALLDTLLTHNQLRMLEVMYRGKAHNRGKYIMVVGEGITPHLKAALDYADREDYQNEIEQVIGILDSAETLSDGSFVFVGTLGSIFITKSLESYEEIVGLYTLVRALNTFMDELFARLWLGWDDSLFIREMILEQSDQDPTVVTKAKELLSKVGNDGVILEALKSYVSESTAYTKKQIERLLGSATPNQLELAEKLQIRRFFDEVESRIDDAEKIVTGLRREVEGLQSIVGTLSDKQVKKVYDTLQDSFRATEEMLTSSERSGVALDIIELILAGTIAFDVVETLEVLQFLSFSFGALPVPMGTLLIMGCTLIGWIGIASGLYLAMRYITKRSAPLLSMSIRLDRPCNVEKLETYLESKPVVTRVSKQDEATDILKVTWDETDRHRWLGEQPKLALT
ncbi:MAG: hypothetical protein ACFFDP_13150, partial [Promethearchaeota archaeon]